MSVCVRRRNPVSPVARKILPYLNKKLHTKDLYTNGVACGKKLSARCRRCTKVCRLLWYVIMYYAFLTTKFLAHAHSVDFYDLGALRGDPIFEEADPCFGSLGFGAPGLGGCSFRYELGNERFTLNRSWVSFGLQGLGLIEWINSERRV